MTLSGLRHLSNIIFCNGLHFSLNSPGISSVSGVALLNQRFHSAGVCVRDPLIPLKLGSFLSKSTISSHDLSGSQPGAGFFGKFSLSRINPPLRKKSYSS